MGINSTPAADRVHIAFFGRTNAGKSSTVNAVIGQELAVVSDIKGTTTDPVYKTMELLPAGPVMIIDTPGIDDHGSIAELRIKKSLQVLNKTDIAILVVDATKGIGVAEQKLLSHFKQKRIPYLIVYNKSDLIDVDLIVEPNVLLISAKHKVGIELLKERIGQLSVKDESTLPIVGDLIQPHDLIILVVSIDRAAPKGRLILPQQQTIRDILASQAVSIVVTEDELVETLKNLVKKPRLVITDSQIFATVSVNTPADILLTSFSILFARYKGDLQQAVNGLRALKTLQDSDRILVVEGCTHHRQCDDIGTVKIPRWIKQFTGKEPQFSVCSGVEFPEDLTSYHLIVHCGGCMLNQREMNYRWQCADDQNVPMTNYGILIAYTQGILQRSLAVFPELVAELEENKDDWC